MSWWGTDVLAGDTPLDYMGEMANIMELPFGYTVDNQANPQLTGYLEGYSFTKEIVELHMPELTEHCQNVKYDRHIAYQVLGVIAMAVGANIDTFRYALLAAIEADPWAEESEDRMKDMEAYQEMVQTYLGVPTPYNSEVLLSNMLQVVEERNIF